jgi:hypothetical protein
MNEINLNPLSRPVGIDKPSNSAASQKNANVMKTSLEPDSTQFSQIPDLSAVEEALEKEFAGLRSTLAQDAESPGYPPLETIDRLAAMLAVDLDQNRSGSAE